jgi:hypothetical protein
MVFSFDGVLLKFYSVNIRSDIYLIKMYIRQHKTNSCLFKLTPVYQY